MKLAICYAGQGAQKTGMGQAFYDNNKAFHAVFDRASSALDFDLKRACFQNPEDILMQTEVTQPALVAFASGVTAALEEKGILQKAAYVLGLSLGEYSALEAAGVWGPEEAVKIAAFRGKAMASAAEGIDCAMSAVIGLEKQQVEDICSEVMKAGESGNATGQTDISGDAKMVDARQPKTGVWLTNDNCPGQVVISGDSASARSGFLSSTILRPGRRIRMRTSPTSLPPRCRTGSVCGNLLTGSLNRAWIPSSKSAPATRSRAS